MQPIPVMVFIAALPLVLGVGFILGRYLSTKASHNKVLALSQKAQTLLSESEAKAQALCDARLHQLEQSWHTKKQASEREADETRRALNKNRQKLAKRQEKLSRRSHRYNEREALLLKANATLEALRRETEQHHRKAKQACDTAETLSRDINARHQTLESERAALDARSQSLNTRLEALNAEHLALEQQKKTYLEKLEQIAGVSREEARRTLAEQLIDEVRLESAAKIKDVRDEAKLTANREARKAVLTAIQRSASSHAIEHTVSVINLDSDDMKGRIIGREGRNIRAFEAATGIEVIVDDTPEAVILSGFDPVRREVARIALNNLIQDGRIHPARIEEVVEKVRAELEEAIIETGERTLIDLGLHGLHPELVRMIGRMRYRTSYGQNLLSHSIEVAKLSSLMAAELDLDPRQARRAGLLHDIGKVIEGDLESPHAIVGMELCRKYKESAQVCNAVGAHHDEIEMTCEIAPIIQASDAISGARPGARREALESYIKRLQNLEKLAGSFKGVQRVYAIQAGRELRVIVNHTLIQDAHAEQLANDIAKRIESEMQYPGQIKVTVIREIRSVSYAK